MTVEPSTKLNLPTPYTTNLKQPWQENCPGKEKRETQSPRQPAARESQQRNALHRLRRDQRRNTSVGMSCERLYRADTFSAFWILV